MSRRATVSLIAVLVGGAAACSSEQHREIHGGGQLCVVPGGATGGSSGNLGTESFGSDDPVTMVVSYGCSPCNVRDFEASCSVLQGGSSLSVASQASFTLVDVTEECSLICRPLAAQCTTAPLSAATYAVGYGSETLALTVPSEASTPCLSAMRAGLFQ